MLRFLPIKKVDHFIKSKCKFELTAQNIVNHSNQLIELLQIMCLSLIFYHGIQTNLEPKNSKLLKCL